MTAAEQFSSTITRYEAGMSLAAIAQEDGRTPMAILLRLRKAGVETRSGGQPRKPVYAVVLAFSRSGSWKQAASEAGLNHEATARRRAQRHGVTATNIHEFRALNEEQRETYRQAVDEDRLSHEDALEIALEY